MEGLDMLVQDMALWPPGSDATGSIPDEVLVVGVKGLIAIAAAVGAVHDQQPLTLQTARQGTNNDDQEALGKDHLTVGMHAIPATVYVLKRHTHA